jgi:hypothetical protein
MLQIEYDNECKLIFMRNEEHDKQCHQLKT